MTKNQLQSKLDQLWGSTVTKLDIDIILHKITLNLHLIRSVGVEEFHSVEFHNVSSYYYAYDMGENRYKAPIREFLELTEIAMVDDDVIRHSNKKNLNYNSQPNFWLGFWTSILLIEAKTIKINNEIIKIKSN
ncbi:MAG: hypothetical protein DWQ07_07960 [Chloroflexi bacterium]|nr:MAG: hypothetical protein DWQ07_07960 [Chloroflexota bacterium]MBL1197027.1 hypothetical protein [Chloroflexota bacterium]NOH14321.1 hypothetical protein [Chloroflexota bacterium]